MVYGKLPACTKNNIYTKLNHQLFSAHSLKIKREEGSLHGNNFLGHRINALSLNKSAMQILKFTPFSFNMPFEFDQLSLQSSILFFTNNFFLQYMYKTLFLSISKSKASKVRFNVLIQFSGSE